MTSLPTSDENDRPNPREDLDARLWKLVEAGILDWGGGKPQGAKHRVVLTEGPLLSQMIIDERR
jgi:hypothetical protein